MEPRKLRARSETSLGFTLVELLVVITIIGILIALLLPAVQMARESGRQTQCRNNVKQLALACLSHEQATGRFPTGGWGHSWTGDADRGNDRRQPGGWIFNILPYIEQQAVHNMGAGLPETEKNALHIQRMGVPLSILYCPTRRAAVTYPYIALIATAGEGLFNADGSPETVGRSDYAANLGVGLVSWNPGTGPGTLEEGDADASGQFSSIAKKATGIVYTGSMIRVADVTDGASNTYLLGEKCLDTANYENGIDDGDNEEALMGADIDILRVTGSGRTPRLDACDPSMRDRLFYRFGSPHPAGCHMAFCDGSIHTINYTIDAVAHKNLGNRKDGKVVDASMY